jgi:hypothetical protein
MTTPTISNIPPVPSPFADLPTTWAFLEAGMNHIMHARTGIFEATYMGLYTTVYNYCSTADRGQSIQLVRCDAPLLEQPHSQVARISVV